MRSYVLQARWLPWHALWLLIVAGCLGMAWWQWNVATSPHPPGAPVQAWRNYAYAVNWVIFAGVAVWFWWRYMRDQRAAEDRAEGAGDFGSAGPDGVSDPVEAASDEGGQTAAPQRLSPMVEFDIFGAAPDPGEADDPGAGRRR